MNKVKLNIKLGVMLLLVLLVSCESSDDFLTEINPNTNTPDSFWNNGDEAERWINACYSGVAYGQGASWQANFPRWFQLATVLRSDEYFTQIGDATIMGATDFTLDANNLWVKWIWDAFWIGISRSNEAIKQISIMENISDDQRKELLGEAQFIRGFSYFYLINFWNKVPHTIVPPSGENEYTPATAERDVIWDQIVEDFTNAKANLAHIKVRDSKTLGRATWGTVTGHLGKVYLFQQEWSKAASEFQELIDSEIYDLVTDYNDNCNDVNENNIESIFEIQCDYTVDQNFSSWRGRDAGPKTYAGSWGYVEPWLLKTFLEEKTIDDKIDPRAFATLIFPHPESTLYGMTYEEAYGTLDPDAEIYWRKYRNCDTKANDNNGFQSSINDRIMRFADVLLMYAEADNEANGPTTAALASINRVRARANMAPIAENINQADFRNAIRKERVLELSAEDNRWMDLKRWGILEDRFSNDEVLSGKRFNMNRHEYWPIPQSDILTNPNLEQYSDY